MAAVSGHLQPLGAQLRAALARASRWSLSLARRRQGPPPAAWPRSAYKSIWTPLADTEERAEFHVGGFVEEEEFRATAVATRATLEATVGIRPSDEILEIGCGVGRVGAAVAPICRRWVGGDISVNMLRHAARRLAGLSNIALVELSGFDLAPIPDASVDVVYCTVVFMHLEEWDRFGYLLEAHRVLRPGGGARLRRQLRSLL